MIGCPVRNRAWILPVYLQHLTKLHYPADQVEFCFIINDCTDNTEQILQEFAAAYPARLLYDYSSLAGGWRRGSYHYGRLAFLRNRLLEAFLTSDCQYLFSIDSDILVPSHSLLQLIQADVDVISALVCNGEEIGDRLFYNIFEQINNCLLPIRDFSRQGVFPVDCTGAAYLIKKQVIASGVRYNACSGPEDIGFCQEVKKHGFSIFCDGRLECRHIMREEEIINPAAFINSIF